MWFTNLSWIIFFFILSQNKTNFLFPFFKVATPCYAWARCAYMTRLFRMVKTVKEIFYFQGGLFIALGLVQVKVSAGLLSKVSVSVLFLQHTPPVPSSFCHHNVQLCACDFSRKVRGVVFKFRCILKISIRISLNISTSVSATKIWYISHQPNIDKKISSMSLCHA